MSNGELRDQWQVIGEIKEDISEIKGDLKALTSQLSVRCPERERDIAELAKKTNGHEREINELRNRMNVLAIKVGIITAPTSSVITLVLAYLVTKTFGIDI